MANLRKMIEEALGFHGETWDDVEFIALGDRGDFEVVTKPVILDKEEAKIRLNYEFDEGYGREEAHAFLIYTKNWIYFKATYDGSEWVTYIPRNPNIKFVPSSVGGG